MGNIYIYICECVCVCFAIVMSNFENYFGNCYGILIRNSVALSPYIITVLCTNAIYFYQPGLIKIHTSVHFLCDTILCTSLHALLQFQREMSTEWR